MMNYKGKLAAQRLYKEFGLNSSHDFEVEDLVHARDIIFEEKSLPHSDGRIVFGSSKAMISINSEIRYAGRRRFTIAHELGHFEMHRGNKLPEDTPLTLDYFKHGNQEYEANEFATELLMPEHEFRKFVQGKVFSPDLLREIAAYFNTSITSSAFRYLQIGPHPIYLFYSRDRNLVYWKKSPNHFLTVKDITRLPVPSDSVAMEFYDHQVIYPKEESAQEIVKSTWFETRGYDDNVPFYEYAIVTKDYNTVLSVVWED